MFLILRVKTLTVQCNLKVKVSGPRAATENDGVVLVL